MRAHVHLQDKALSLTCGDMELRQLCGTGFMHEYWELLRDTEFEKLQRKKH